MAKGLSLLVLIRSIATVSSANLAGLCNSAGVSRSLPYIAGIEYGAVSASGVSNVTVREGDNYPGVSNRNLCNVSINYAHTSRNDSINVYYYLPVPSQWAGRFLATGGEAYQINSGLSALEAGLVYDSAAGLTDGGLGSLTTSLTDVVVPANGTLNWELLTNFAYLSIHEMTEIGTGLVRSYYGNSSKIFTYYQACSEGGREGWSQIQRYGSQYDGAVIGAPAFRQAFQQPNHMWPQIQQANAGYVPTTCEIQRIINDTITACDNLDGRKDGVVARTDLCLLQYNTSSSIGNRYSCAASSEMGSFGGPTRRQIGGGPTDGASGGSGSTPAQNGTVTKEGVAAWNALVHGPYDSKGRHLYIGYQPGAEASSDVAGSYNSTSGTYYASASGIGAQWVNMFLNEINSSDLSLTGVTADTLRGWMLEGLQRYSATLQTVWTDLEDFQNHGGKVIHYHGEADASVPTISSTIYHDQVRRVMYPDLSYADGIEALGEFYKLFLIPGAGHCAPSALNGPFPQTMIGSIIDWVENGVAPKSYLNATILQGSLKGTRQDICAWPARPHWTGNASGTPDCVSPDSDALDTWYPTLDSIPLNVYGVA